MSWQSYPEYKPSGIEWLGDIPERWEAIRFKFVLSEQLTYGANESAEYDEPTWPRYVRITDVNENGTLRTETFKSLPEEVARPYLLKEGDLLLARSGATVGKTFLYLESWGRAAYAGYLIRARLNQSEMLPTFAAYFCRSNNYWDWLRSSFIQATIQNVSAERYVNMIVPKPPIDEQCAIVNFLECETARIDALLEKKQRQIELLQEKRATLIGHAVTKGLNVNTKLHSIPIPWLCNIPKHWRVLQLRRVVTQFIDYRGKTPIKTDAGVPLITAGAVKNGVINHSLVPEYISEDEYEAWMSRGLPEAGDVVVTTEAPLAEVAQVQDVHVAFAQRIILFKVNRKLIMPEFLRYYYMSNNGRAELLSRASGSTATGIRSDRLRMSLVPVPPLAEQQLIVDYLDQRVENLAVIITHIESSITNLREYRTTLISVAVTGKIDVRKEVV